MSSTVVVLLWVIGVAGLLADVFAGSLVLGALSVTALVASVVCAGLTWGPLEALGLGAGSATIAVGIIKLAASRLALGERPAAGPAAALADDRQALVGQSGVAATTLRPAGFATIGGRRIDVVTQGDMIEQGAPVQVLAVEGPRVVVRGV